MSWFDEGEPGALPGTAHESVRAGLRHEPFFMALAALGGHEGEREWRALLAGLVTLRLADRRLACSGDGASPAPRLLTLDEWSAGVPVDVVEAARAAVGEIDDQESVALPLRDLCRSASGAAAWEIPHQLLAYANTLHADSRWPLAVDVYRTVLEFADNTRLIGLDATASIQRLVPHTYDRLGRSLRMTGDLDGARAAYDAGCAAARLLGDDNAEQLMRISQAKILMHVGNLPAAAAALDAIIREAVVPSPGRSDAEERPAGSGNISGDKDRAETIALARHDRGLVATLQHDFNLAAEHYFAAWHAHRDPDERERVWVDLGLNFGEMGRRDVARETFLVLYANARRAEIRFIAATNLLEIATLDGREDLFEMYRALLDDADQHGSLPAEVRAKLALYVGRGEARFGRHKPAVATLERALALAVLHRVNEVVIHADEALADLRAGRPITHWSTQAPPIAITPSVERITRVVRRARRRIGTLPY